MKSSTRRDIIGTALMFMLLLAGTFMIVLGEKFLENFKSH